MWLKTLPCALTCSLLARKKYLWQRAAAAGASQNIAKIENVWVELMPTHEYIGPAYRCKDCGRWGCGACMMDDAWQKRMVDQVFLCYQCYRAYTAVDKTLDKTAVQSYSLIFFHFLIINGGQLLVRKFPFALLLTIGFHINCKLCKLSIVLLHHDFFIIVG